MQKNFPDPKGLNQDLHSIDFKAVWMLDPGIAVVEREGSRSSSQLSGNEGSSSQERSESSEAENDRGLISKNPPHDPSSGNSSDLRPRDVDSQLPIGGTVTSSLVFYGNATAPAGEIAPMVQQAQAPLADPAACPDVLQPAAVGGSPSPTGSASEGQQRHFKGAVVVAGEEARYEAYESGCERDVWVLQETGEHFVGKLSTKEVLLSAISGLSKLKSLWWAVAHGFASCVGSIAVTAVQLLLPRHLRCFCCLSSCAATAR